MAIAVKQNLVSSSKYSIKCPYPMEAEYITFHETANDATAEGEVKYMISNNNQVSYHFAVDEDTVVQGIPVNRNAWHCGDGGSGKGNRKSIGVEVCYSKSGGAKYNKAKALAIKFVAQLLHERGWGIDRVKPHQHWSGKYCPHRTLAETGFKSVLDAIQKELNALKGTSNVVVSKPAPSAPKGYVDMGDKGAQVTEVQNMLNKAGYNVGKADGIFGKNTESGVKAFQKDHGLAVDGIVGNSTMQVLDALCDHIDAKAKADAEAKQAKDAKAKADVEAKQAEQAKAKATATKKALDEAMKKAKAEVAQIAKDSNVYGYVTVLAENLNIREKPDFNSKIVKVAKKGAKYKAYNQKNGLYGLGGANYCSSNPKYVRFEKNPHYGAKPKLLEVTTATLYTYKTANWNDKGVTVKKGEVFTVVKELTVKGSKMYQLKSGLYITANPSYVKVQ